MTIKRYLAESSVLVGVATVTAREHDEQGLCVRLNQTWFHPQGGGQKACRGTLDEYVVIHVAHAEGGNEVNHYLEREADLAIGQEVALTVDEEWRFNNARWHSGGHLLAAVIESIYPTIKPVSGHHWPGEGRIECESNASAFPEIERVREELEEGAAVAIANNLPFRIVGDPYRSRTIQIGDYRPVPCGGTHVTDTSCLEYLEVTSLKVKSGKLRISYKL